MKRELELQNDPPWLWSEVTQANSSEPTLANLRQNSWTTDVLPLEGVRSVGLELYAVSSTNNATATFSICGRAKTGSVPGTTKPCTPQGVLVGTFVGTVDTGVKVAHPLTAETTYDWSPAYNVTASADRGYGLDIRGAVDTSAGFPCLIVLSDLAQLDELLVVWTAKDANISRLLLIAHKL